MRGKDIKGLINDLLGMLYLDHPLTHFSEVASVKVDLLKKTITYPDKDSVRTFYEKKVNWFNDRIDKLNARADFQSAKMFVIGRTESVEIVFKNKIFKGETVFAEASLPDSIGADRKK